MCVKIRAATVRVRCGPRCLSHVGSLALPTHRSSRVHAEHLRSRGPVIWNYLVMPFQDLLKPPAGIGFAAC